MENEAKSKRKKIPRGRSIGKKEELSGDSVSSLHGLEYGETSGEKLEEFIAEYRQQSLAGFAGLLKFHCLPNSLLLRTSNANGAVTGSKPR